MMKIEHQLPLRREAAEVLVKPWGEWTEDDKMTVAVAGDLVGTTTARPPFGERILTAIREDVPPPIMDRDIGADIFVFDGDGVLNAVTKFRPHVDMEALRDAGILERTRCIELDTMHADPGEIRAVVRDLVDSCLFATELDLTSLRFVPKSRDPFRAFLNPAFPSTMKWDEDLFATALDEALVQPSLLDTISLTSDGLEALIDVLKRHPGQIKIKQLTLVQSKEADFTELVERLITLLTMDDLAELETLSFRFIDLQVLVTELGRADRNFPSVKKLILKDLPTSNRREMPDADGINSMRQAFPNLEELALSQLQRTGDVSALRGLKVLDLGGLYFVGMSVGDQLLDLIPRLNEARQEEGRDCPELVVLPSNVADSVFVALREMSYTDISMNFKVEILQNLEYEADYTVSEAIPHAQQFLRANPGSSVTIEKYLVNQHWADQLQQCARQGGWDLNLVAVRSSFSGVLYKATLVMREGRPFRLEDYV